jgi:hypothetical protein
VPVPATTPAAASSRTQLAEAAVFLGLAGVLLAAASRLVRRHTA